MNKQAFRSIIKPLKPLLSRTVWREGTVRTILAGPCKGLRYRIFPEFGLSPLYGGWEQDAQRLMVEHICPKSVAYDIGANYGIHVLLMSRLVTGAGRVFAFEPVPQIAEQLQGNVSLNQFSNVTCVRMAVDDHNGTEAFHGGHHDGAGHLAAAGSTVGEKLVVETTTLDDFVFERNNHPPDFIKIDVEGAESRVLSGGKRVLQTSRPVLLVDLHNPEQDVAVGCLLSEHSYEAYRTEDGSRVADLGKGWPEPDGLWGQIIAFPVTRRRT